VRHTGDGFFVVFDRASDAVDAAVAIQRRLAKHRKEHGFSPRVRIGLHQTEATYEGGDFSGYGVHVASRIESAADQDEILASEALIGAVSAIRYPLGEVRSVSLKGVADPAHVQSIDWR
jgi:class 3 adenylate cyclase